MAPLMKGNVGEIAWYKKELTSTYHPCSLKFVIWLTASLTSDLFWHVGNGACFYMCSICIAAWSFWLGGFSLCVSRSWQAAGWRRSEVSPYQKAPRGGSKGPCYFFKDTGLDTLAHSRVISYKTRGECNRNLNAASFGATPYVSIRSPITARALALPNKQ